MKCSLIEWQKYNEPETSIFTTGAGSIATGGVFWFFFHDQKWIHGYIHFGKTLDMVVLLTCVIATLDWHSELIGSILGGYFFFWNGSVQRYAARFSTIGLIRWVPSKEGDAFAGISFEHQTKRNNFKINYCSHFAITNTFSKSEWICFINIDFTFFPPIWQKIHTTKKPFPNTNRVFCINKNSHQLKPNLHSYKFRFYSVNWNTFHLYFYDSQDGVSFIQYSCRCARVEFARGSRRDGRTSSCSRWIRIIGWRCQGFLSKLYSCSRQTTYWSRVSLEIVLVHF